MRAPLTRLRRPGHHGRRIVPWIALCLAVATPAGAHGQIVRTGAGPDAASIQAAVDQFRLDLGALNPNAVGSFGSGRREINWDGVPIAATSPNAFPGDFFNGNVPGRARGVVFSTPGSGFLVSANAGAGPVEFDDLNPTYPSVFGVFSPQKLFTSVGSNVMDVNFFVPGSGTPAGSRGFGAVFTDVDVANTTSIQYFDVHGVSLGTFFAPPFVGTTVPSETFSFLGVSFATPIVGRVRITSGNTALGPNDGGGTDVVVMDDFIYGEPVAVAAVPEPTTVTLAGIGIAALALAARRRRTA